jgi:hypothetical protein
MSGARRSGNPWPTVTSTESTAKVLCAPSDQRKSPANVGRVWTVTSMPPDLSNVSIGRVCSPMVSDVAPSGIARVCGTRRSRLPVSMDDVGTVAPLSDGSIVQRYWTTGGSFGAPPKVCGTTRSKRSATIPASTRTSSGKPCANAEPENDKNAELADPSFFGAVAPEIRLATTPGAAIPEIMADLTSEGWFASATTAPRIAKAKDRSRARTRATWHAGRP